MVKKACIVDTWDDGNAYRAELLESGKCVFVPLDDDRCAWWYPDQVDALREHIQSLHPQIDALEQQEIDAMEAVRSIAAKNRESKKYQETVVGNGSDKLGERVEKLVSSAHVRWK